MLVHGDLGEVVKLFGGLDHVDVCASFVVRGKEPELFAGRVAPLRLR